VAVLFVSYASSHRDRVEELANDLQSLGHEVWFDQELTGGQAWWDQILARIRRCDAFVLVLTSETLDSEACRRELAYAIALGRTLLPIRLASPVDLDHVPPEVSVRQIVAYGTGDKAGVLELNRALQRLEPSGPLPEPLPPPPSVPISYVAEIIDEIRRKDQLSYDEQVAIVFRLRDHLHETGDVTGVSKAYGILLKRRELYAKVRDEIQQILARAGTAPPPTTQGQRGSAVPTTSGGPRDTRGLGCGLAAVSFLLPVVGLVLFFVFLQSRPRASTEAIAWAIAGFVLTCFCGLLVPFFEALLLEFEPAYNPYPPMYPGM